MPRKLLFFFDGSSNTIVGPAPVVPTNIYYLNQAFTSGKSNSPQILFYFSGVGTHGDRLSAATGRGFDEIVINAYTNLASNYQKHDKIYLFGFSRGAAAARVLTALISWPGLLKETELVNHFQHIWDLYVHFPPGTPESESNARHRQSLLDKIKTRDYTAVWNPTPKVSFLGVFDTVPGLSWDREKAFIKLRIRNLTLEPCVEKAVHLLSVDDNRIPSFEPLLWDSKSNDTQHVEQIWLPGVHSDVGGSSDAVFIGYVALLTMLYRILDLCPELELENGFIEDISKKAFNDPPSLHISNERLSLPMKLLLKGKRAPKAPGVRPGEMIHELLRAIQGQRMNIRGNVRRYDVHESWLQLPTYTSPFTAQLLDAVRRRSSM